MAAVSFLLIESQCCYARYSRAMRKVQTRISVSLGGGCIYFIGLMCFSQVAIFAMVSTYTLTPLSSVEGKYYELKGVIYLVVFFSWEFMRL